MNAIDRRLQAVDRLQQRWPVIAFPVAVWSKFNDDQAGNLAALISYYAYAALLPMLLIAVTVLNIVLRNDPSLRADLLQSAVSQYPMLGTIKSDLGSIPGTGPALVIGIVLLLLGARGVARAMQNALCVVWDIPKDSRPGFPWSYLWAFALLSTIGGGFVVTTFLSSVAGGVGQVINGAVAHVATVLISLVVNVGVFWLSFRIATARLVPWRQLRTGAAVAAVCWQILQVTAGYFISHQLHRASELYGTFGIVLGLLTWLFLQAEVTLYAAEADVVLARRLWPRSVLPAKEEPTQEGQLAEGSQPVQDQEGGGGQAPEDDRSSLEEEPGGDRQADAGGQDSMPSPRGESPASDKKAGFSR
jgi:YihY family inner membrane protein